MSETPQPTKDDELGPLRESTARGFLWTGGQALVNRGLSMVGFIVLARLLTPHEYGVVALANVFVLLLAIFVASGYSQVLVQRPQLYKEDLDTVFWIGTATSVAFALVMVGAAWPLAAAFHEPDLRPVLQVLSVTFVFIALGSANQAVLQRRLEFRRIAQVSILANVVATVVGITFAVLGFGVWSLVVQTVVGSALTSLGVMMRSGYRPGRSVSLARFRLLFDSSRNFLGTTLMTFFNQRTDDFLIGSVLGAQLLGIYTVAYRILTVMTDVLAMSVRQVAFPVFSRIQDDKPRLLRAYTSAMRMSAVVGFPAFFFALAAAPEIVHVVFGGQWDRSVPIMRILCLFGALQVVFQFNGALLQSVGRARAVFRITLLSTILQLPAFAIAVQYGIRWVAASYVIRAYLVAPVGLIMAARELDSTLRKTIAGLVAPSLSTGAMVAAVFAVKPALGEVAPEGVRLLVLMGVGLAAYVAALRLLGPRTFDEALRYARSAARRGTGRAAPTAA